MLTGEPRPDFLMADVEVKENQVVLLCAGDLTTACLTGAGMRYAPGSWLRSQGIAGHSASFHPDPNFEIRVRSRHWNACSGLSIK